MLHFSIPFNWFVSWCFVVFMAVIKFTWEAGTSIILGMLFINNIVVASFVMVIVIIERGTVGVVFDRVSIAAIEIVVATMAVVAVVIFVDDMVSIVMSMVTVVVVVIVVVLDNDDFNLWLRRWFMLSSSASGA